MAFKTVILIAGLGAVLAGGLAAGSIPVASPVSGRAAADHAALARIEAQGAPTVDFPAGRAEGDHTTAVGLAADHAALARIEAQGATAVALATNRTAADAPFYSNTFEKTPAVAAMTALGRTLFFDTSLSASGKMACATCHSPNHAFAPENDLAVQRGGRDGRWSGARAVPSLMYTQNIPPFTEHYVDDEGNDSIDQGPAGGRMWDGRVQSAHDQARLPLLSPFEMANTGMEAVVAKVEYGGNAAQFRDTFGDRVFEDKSLAFKGVLLALETYQQSPAEFYPYTSKYDAWLRHEASLTSEESRGLDAFNDPAKGNCARCHPSSVRAGAFPQFTDFGYAAIGVPRNPAIPANANPRYFDLGLCGPLRTDLADKKEYCGLFRTPGLRNVARRRAFFHNGVFHRLADAVRFYAQRDTLPQKWYPHTADGAVQKFDDLPPQYQMNLDHETPFDRHAGNRPSLSEADIRDIVAFLNTLTDGYEAVKTASASSVALNSKYLENRYGGLGSECQRRAPERERGYNLNHIRPHAGLT